MFSLQLGGGAKCTARTYVMYQATSSFLKSGRTQKPVYLTRRTILPRGLIDRYFRTDYGGYVTLLTLDPSAVCPALF